MQVVSMYLLGRRESSSSLGLGPSDELVFRPENDSAEYSGILRRMNNYARNAAGKYATLAMLGLAAAGAALTTSACSFGDKRDPCNREDTISNPISPSSPGCPTPGPTPPPVQEVGVSGFVKRILRDSNGGTTIVYQYKDPDNNEKQFRFATDGSGDYSGKVMPNITYGVDVSGEHHPYSASVPVKTSPKKVDFWVLDSDDPDPNSPYNFSASVLDELFRPNNVPLRRWERSPRFRIYKANWTEGIIRENGQKPTEKQILDTVEAALRSTVPIACGRLVCLGVAPGTEGVEYVDGARPSDAQIPRGHIVDVYAVVGGTEDAGLAPVTVSVNEVVGGYIQFNVGLLGSLGGLSQVAVHETGHILQGSPYHSESSKFMKSKPPYSISTLDRNVFRAGYSLPTGTHDYAFVIVLDVQSTSKKNATQQSGQRNEVPQHVPQHEMPQQEVPQHESPQQEDPQPVPPEMRNRGIQRFGLFDRPIDRMPY